MLQERLLRFLNFACIVPLFKSLDRNELEILFQTFDYHKVSKGAVIVNEDAKRESKFYIILSGRVKVITISEDGDEKIISFLEAGSFFGEMALLEQRPRSASVIAVKDCELYSLSSIAFFRMLELFPKVAIELLRDLSSRLRVVNEQIVNSAFMSTPEQIRNYLFNLSMQRGKRESDSRVVVADMPSQATIAHYLNCSRESVSREMTRLEKSKVIQRLQNKRMVILDEEVLQN